MNTRTPRIFIAAAQQNDGKTTTSLGLFGALQKRFPRIGYIKPIGQRFVDVHGSKIDEDSVLIEQTYAVQTPIEAMSPIAVEPDFTRKYIEHAHYEEIAQRIVSAFDLAADEKDFVIIEGSGHAGVGSVFDLSNARVAKVLGSKAILITRGGIGRAVDEAALNKALFDKEGVELIGVILNKVLPDKVDFINNITRRGLARLGIDLLGVIPAEPVLANPTMEQVCKALSGRYLNARRSRHRRFRKVIIGAMKVAHIEEHFQPGTLLIVSGDRKATILRALANHELAVAEGRSALAGIVLSEDMLPQQSVLDQISASKLPVIMSSFDTYKTVNAISSMTIKTQPGDEEKIAKIQSLIEQYVDIDRLLGKL